MTGSGARTPCASARMAAQRRAQAKKPWTAGPPQSWTTKPESRSRAGTPMISHSSNRTRRSSARLSDCLHRNVHGWAPAPPVESAGSAPPVDLLKQRPAERAQVGVARLDEPLAKHTLQGDFIRLADCCRLDAAWRGTDAGHDKPSRKRLALVEHIFIHSAWHYLSHSFGLHGGLAPIAVAYSVHTASSSPRG